jgi:hypothetical protein
MVAAIERRLSVDVSQTTWAKPAAEPEMQHVCGVTKQTRVDTPNGRRSVTRWPASDKIHYKTIEKK